ncbi:MULTISPECIES: cytochrome c/FTR1 family iron permease [Hydrocarboniphaga]|uniref:Cytochrome c subfamily, putative n=1 Tax=Hydrocarboniphaga effusa AP103 TaxID=1172194 RepID=I8T210_9GAMM|nr:MULTISPECIES: cytochrome c/FTR1 family iron permease [Hydrocarboniphaga]EIT67713.1 Cytochrome c subfamily, putative [Hydrocarboniphaga effusa AP103]MDZ4079762.1 cytochrome c/FTR1 family iron permease [Hydrocarboniphaga sp.]
MTRLRSLLALLLLWPLMSLAAGDAQTTWRLLDYIAVDYAGAVDNSGTVIDAAEYAEMSEFSDSVNRQLAALVPTPAQPALVQEAQGLKSAIEAKADPGAVATLARGLGAKLLEAYPVPLSPKTAPDLAKGLTQYATLCAGCHGASGHGDGPLAAGMDPAPVDFTDLGRARERSIFALYQVISQGLEGTAMSSFAHLPDEERWALAFVVGQFAFPQDQAAAGAQFWQQATAQEAIPDLSALATTTPAILEARVGAEQAQSVMAYLRRNPGTVLRSTEGSLQLVRDRLEQAVAAYRKGDRDAASQAAVSAYLDGFEPVEPILGVKNPELMRALEMAMTELRGRISAGASVDEIAGRVADLQSRLGAAEQTLKDSSSDAGSAFVGAFTILLREGLEALLIVVAIIAFLRKAGRTEVLPYVHAGTGAALLAGVATWGAATYLIDISGASRELTEGVAALFAAAVLLFVGIWMHGKSQAGAWQRYVKEKIGAALSQRSAWFLFLLAFVVVYREVFETILFYVALWSQGAEQAVIAGAVTAIAALAVIAWLMLRYSRKLPIGTFFTISAVLMAILAVMLTGKGIAALQEANLLSARLLDLPRFDWIGFYPTLQGLVAQLACASVLMTGFAYNWRRAAT